MSATNSPLPLANAEQSEGEMSDEGECSEAVESAEMTAEENEAELDFEPDEPAESVAKSDAEDKEDGEMEDSDEGQISSEDEGFEEKKVERVPPKEVEEGEVDDGEEVPTPVEMEEKTREKGGICKFYARGQCTWGPECKFQHTGTSKGNYQMFPDARPIASLIPPGGLAKVKMPPRYPARDKVDPPEIPPLIPPLIPRVSAPTDDTESAWERGLKQAKELMKKSAVRQEGDGDVSDTPKKSTIPSLIQADLIEPTGRRPSSYESSEPDRSETGSNRGNRKLIAPPEPEIGPFVNRGGRPHRNDRNYQNYPNDREEYSNRRYGQQQDYFDRRYEESVEFGDEAFSDRARGDYTRQQQRPYENRGNNRGGRGNFRPGPDRDNFEPPIYPLIGPTGRPDGFYNRGGDNRNRRGNNAGGGRRDNNQYRQERSDEGRPLPYDLPPNRSYEADWNDPWSRGARPGNRRRSGSSSSGGSRGARRNRSTSSSTSSESSSTASRSRSSSSSSSRSSKRAKVKAGSAQQAKPPLVNRPGQNRPAQIPPQIPVKKIPLPNTSPSQSPNATVKRPKSGGVLSPPPPGSNRQNSPVTKPPIDDRSPIKLTIVNRSKVKNLAEGEVEPGQDRLSNMQNKRKSDDTGRKPAANQSQSGNGKLTAAGKRQKVEKSSGGGNSAGADKNEKSTKSRREELLRQLKAVEDAIARKRSKIS